MGAQEPQDWSLAAWSQGLCVWGAVKTHAALAWGPCAWAPTALSQVPCAQGPVKTWCAVGEGNGSSLPHAWVYPSYLCWGLGGAGPGLSCEGALLPCPSAGCSRLYCCQDVCLRRGRESPPAMWTQSSSYQDPSRGSLGGALSHPPAPSHCWQVPAGRRGGGEEGLEREAVRQSLGRLLECCFWLGPVQAGSDSVPFPPTPVPPNGQTPIGFSGTCLKCRVLEHFPDGLPALVYLPYSLK